MNRFSRHRAVCQVLVLAICCPLLGGAVESGALRVRGDDYPRVFFFRQVEGAAASGRYTYDEWEKSFERLMGIEGKVLEEEVPGRSIRNIDFFTRFKRRHPEQLVLLHYNGNARDPRFESQRFFAGHWVYHNGATILSDLPAERGEIDIGVSDATLFRTNVGRYRTANEDIGLCVLDDKGRPNWHVSEQVQLISVDLRKKTIRVRRGCYGTAPRAFGAGRAYAAAHVTEGPWGRRSHLLWFYNYSTKCPVDKQGRTCSDIHVAHLAELFGSNGALDAFDGLEFDVLHNKCHGAAGRRGPDCDADGRIDSGYFDGINTYGIGVIEFCRKLRQALGEERLILADGHSTNNQRAFGLLNGIESEGWPALRDYRIDDWSGGLNRHFFWDENGRAPRFNYINHKFNVPSGKPGVVKRADVPFSTHRLVFAAGVFTNSAMCYSFSPPNDAGGAMGIWDEFRAGRANRLGYLGKPLGPAVHIAKGRPDMLKGAGKDFGGDIVSRFTGAGVNFSVDRGVLKVSAKSAKAREIKFRLGDVPCEGPDLFVALTAHAATMTHYPEEMPRLMYAGIAPDRDRLIRPDLPRIGMRLRGKKETELDPVSGAAVGFRSGVAIEGKARNCYFVHPPYMQGLAGYAYWQRELAVGRNAELDFYLGMGEKSPQRSDGVTFIVEIAETRGREDSQFSEIFRHTQKAHKWTHHSVSLDRWAGKTVQLRFISDPGPADNATTDHSFWADVSVGAPQSRNIATKPARYMTWAGREPFSSAFYFSDVRSEKVDLEFTIEGAEPLWISAISVHAGPDAMYRLFEKGLVLANPSPRPYTFDLQELFPNARFRRLDATVNQDTTTNNGAVAANTLTIDPKDALFLIKQAD